MSKDTKNAWYVYFYLIIHTVINENILGANSKIEKIFNYDLTGKPARTLELVIWKFLQNIWMYDKEYINF